LGLLGSNVRLAALKLAMVTNKPIGSFFQVDLICSNVSPAYCQTVDRLLPTGLTKNGKRLNQKRQLPCPDSAGRTVVRPQPCRSSTITPLVVIMPIVG